MKNDIPFYLLLLPSIIAGILALIGSYFGSKLNRKSQHEKLLLEKRTTIFQSFLETLDYCDQERTADLTMPIHLIYQPLRLQIGSVKLYLKDSDKTTFESLVNKFIINSQHDIEYIYRKSSVKGFEKCREIALNIKNEIENILNTYLRL